MDTPALIVDLDTVQANVDDMARTAASAGVRLRPHIKSHKMPSLAQVQLAAGAAGVTCATLDEAEVMAEAGCDDLLLAFPMWGPAKLKRLDALRERVRLRVSLDSVQVAEQLAAGLARPIEALVEVDTGMGRLGRPPGQPTAELVADIARIPGIEVVGLLSHAGHSYRARSPAALRVVAEREVAGLVETARMYGADLEISVGATPAVRDEVAQPGVTEIRPGNYIFNDATMIGLGVATERTCAARVLTTVIAAPVPGRFVIDAGTKSLAADGPPDAIVVAGRPDLRLRFLNEEHGIGHGDGVQIGDRLELIPNHICPVSNLFDRAYGVRDGVLVRDLPITARRRSPLCEG